MIEQPNTMVSMIDTTNDFTIRLESVTIYTYKII
jgi:hypothetical protein